MKASSSMFVFFTCVGLSLASFTAYTANRLPDSQCHQRHILGQHGCCCGRSNPNCTNAFGRPCGGDISGDICPESHILLLNGAGPFADSKAVYTDGSCDVQSVGGGYCPEQKWMYIYTCCECPTGFTVSSMGQCDDGAICAGCTGANEMLTYNKTHGYACVVNEEA